jgi:hypothetical protein
VIHRDQMLCSCLQTQALHVKSHENFFRSVFFGARMWGRVLIILDDVTNRCPMF